MNIKDNKAIAVLSLVLPVLAGTMIYLTLSPETYVSSEFWHIVGRENPLQNVRIEEMPRSVQFARFYLCDFMWALALHQAIILILGKDKLGIAVTISTAFCVVCECAQILEYIPGTFDVWDLIVESLAGVFIIQFYIYRRRKAYEKTNKCNVGAWSVRCYGTGQRREE